jgi:hypothetical protein
MRAPARGGFSALGAGGKEGSLPANRAARRRAHPSRVVTPASLSLSSAIALPPSKRRAGSWGRQRPRARLDRPLGLWGARVGRVGGGVSGEGGWSVSDDRGLARFALSLALSLARARSSPAVPSPRSDPALRDPSPSTDPWRGGEGARRHGAGEADGGGRKPVQRMLPSPLAPASLLPARLCSPRGPRSPARPRRRAASNPT